MLVFILFFSIFCSLSSFAQEDLSQILIVYGASSLEEQIVSLSLESKMEMLSKAIGRVKNLSNEEELYKELLKLGILLLDKAVRKEIKPSTLKSLVTTLTKRLKNLGSRNRDLTIIVLGIVGVEYNGPQF